MSGQRLAVLSRHLQADGPSHPTNCISLEHASGSSGMADGIVIGDDVKRALQDGSPVVALESTIISHGMPFPQNLKTAREVEAVVRANGATPATIAVLQGVPHVGLTNEQLRHFAQSGAAVRKTSRRRGRPAPPPAQPCRLRRLARSACIARTSPGPAVADCACHPCMPPVRRDLPYVMSRRLDGATTVSATMLLAARAGIPVFVTGGALAAAPAAAAACLHLYPSRPLWHQEPGTSQVPPTPAVTVPRCTIGIGGVHRGGESSMDVSADLTELARTPVAVVCAGVKSLLDIPRTLEYLETQVQPLVYCTSCLYLEYT